MRRQPTANELLAQWIPIIAGDVPLWDAFTDEACHELVGALITAGSRSGGTRDNRQEVLTEALIRFGRELGQQGWLLREITGWVDALAILSGPYRGALSKFNSGVAVAQGWSDGALHGAQTEHCIDPLTGLVTLPVLHVRLGQAYDQCAALGSSAADLYCLIMIDTVMAELHPFERDAVRAVAAELASEVFAGGETLAHHDGRIMILASSHEAVRERLLDLIVAFDGSPMLDSCSPVCWIERLPATPAQLDRYLFELIPSTL